MPKLASAPFLKIEATKFTEVGYVGRDVESMIRDLTELSVNMVKKEEQERVNEKAKVLAEEKVLDLLMPRRSAAAANEDEAQEDISREKIRTRFRTGKFDETFVDLEVRTRALPIIGFFLQQEWKRWTCRFATCSATCSRRKQKKKSESERGL